MFSYKESIFLDKRESSRNLRLERDLIFTEKDLEGVKNEIKR